MKIAVIMPVFRRPKTACNATGCFLLQSLPPEVHAQLFVIDDGGTFSSLGQAFPAHRNVALWRTGRRFSTLAAKYNRALEDILSHYSPDIVALFDDDDVYLPWHLLVHAIALRDKERAWSKPSRVLTDFHGGIQEETADGRFHGSIAFTANVASRWDERAGENFDQIFMASLFAECGPAIDTLSVYPKPSYLFRWHTGYYHGQWGMGKAGNAWYEQVEIIAPEPPRDVLVAKLDAFTEKLLRENLR